MLSTCMEVYRRVPVAVVIPAGGEDVYRALPAVNSGQYINTTCRGSQTLRSPSRSGT